MACHGLVKTLLFFVNFIFSLIGLGIFIVGVLGIVYIKKINDMYPDFPIESYKAAIIMIIGTIVFFISFSGCCGAIKEINCLLFMYIIVMLLLALAKIAVAVYLLMNKTTAVNELNKYVNETDIAQNSDLHVIEYMIKCCGTTGPDSYIKANVSIPNTCCPISFSGTQETCANTNADIYLEGCKEIAPKIIVTYLNIAIYTLLGIAVFELLSMISACYLTCLRRKGDYYDYD